jgi:hypothetical protein
MSVTVFDMTGGMSQKVFELTRNKHTLSDLRNNYFPESPAQVGSEYTYGQMHTRCGRKVTRLATLCTNRQRCCLPLHMAVRLTPAVD